MLPTDLLERIRKAQEDLRQNGLNGKKLEEIKADMRAAFDTAIDSITPSTDWLTELNTRKEQLKSWRVSIASTLLPIQFRYALSAPFIYGISIPIFAFHASLEIYHQVCFRLYRIPLVSAKEYFIYDRQLLPYLNAFEKMNCIYCSYVNNLFRYASEIGGRTERFWCPIKYHKRISGAHSQYECFAEYLDASAYREKAQVLRDFSDLSKK